jgi:sulfoxide reductase heme-binding subunit YedZ
MSQMNLYHDNHERDTSNPLMRRVVWVLGVGLLAMAGLFTALLLVSPLGNVLGSSVSQLFALNSVQVMWYITRAAGLVGYVLLWLSTAWGLAVSSKILDLFLHRSFTYDFHQFLSLLAIGFIALHISVLMADRYLPYNLAQILLPFLSPYRPLWVGIGVIGFYLTLLVTVTFYLRSRIGARAFRSIHVFSLVAYLAATVHGFFAGTDSPLLSTELIYAVTFLVTVFLTTYWLATLLQKKLRTSNNKITDSGMD